MCLWSGYKLSSQSGLEKRNIRSSPLCYLLGVGKDTIHWPLATQVTLPVLPATTPGEADFDCLSDGALNRDCIRDLFCCAPSSQAAAFRIKIAFEDITCLTSSIILSPFTFKGMSTATFAATPLMKISRVYPKTN